MASTRARAPRETVRLYRFACPGAASKVPTRDVSWQWYAGVVRCAAPMSAIFALPAVFRRWRSRPKWPIHSRKRRHSPIRAIRAFGFTGTRVPSPHLGASRRATARRPRPPARGQPGQSEFLRRSVFRRDGCTALPKQANAESCGSVGGWFLEPPTNPTMIMLCPSTCADIVDAPAGQILAGQNFGDLPCNDAGVALR